MKQKIDIAQCIEQNLKQYFKDLNGETPCAVYEWCSTKSKKPLLGCVMEECGGNQSKAAAVLGLNRNTLRKKLVQTRVAGKLKKTRQAV